MKPLFFLLSFLISCGLACAELPKQWLDEYYDVFWKYENAETEFLLSKHPEWRQRLEVKRKWQEADVAMYRYLFIHHLEHHTVTLKWFNGYWM